MNPLAQFLTLLSSVWRRRTMALVIAWLVCLVGWWLVIMQPDRYESSARVYVDTENILRPLLRGLAVDNNLEAEVELIQRTLMSRPNLEKVARMTDLDIGAETPGELESLVNDLSNRTNVDRVGPNLFSIAFTDSDPRVARDVAQAFLTIFVESNLGQSRRDMETARRFIEEQIVAYEDQLELAEQRLAQFKQENIGLLSGQQGYQQRLTQAESQLGATRAQLRDSQLRAATLQRELNATPQFFAGTRTVNRGPGGTSDPFAGPPSDTHLRILEAEQLVESLLSRFTEKHPDVVVATRRLEALQEQQKEELQARLDAADSAGPAPDVEETETIVQGPPNPLYEQLKIQLVTEEGTIAALNDRIIQAQAGVDELLRLRQAVPAVEAEYIKLNRDYEVIKSKYEEFLSRREAERISRAREVEGESIQFRIIEPPQVPVHPAGPDRVLYLTAVLIVGIGSGLAFALLLAFSSDKMSTMLQLKEAFQLPVLGAVSMIESRGRQSRRLVGATAFLVALVALFGSYGALNYIEQELGLDKSALADLADEHIPAEWRSKLPSI